MSNSSASEALVPFEWPLPAQCLTPVSLALPPGLSFEAWSNLGPAIHRLHDSALWWIGDWLLYGETHYGQPHAQVLPVHPYKPATLRVAVWVCQAFPPSRRRTTLPFSHHREVVPLPPEEQSRVLDLAEEGQWTVRQLRAYVQAAGQGTGEEPDSKQDASATHGGVSLPPARLDAIRAHSDYRRGKIWTDDDHAQLLDWLESGL